MERKPLLAGEHDFLSDRNTVSLGSKCIVNDETHGIYNFLFRDSKQKLEALLQKWSEWHAQHVPPTHVSFLYYR